MSISVMPSDRDVRTLAGIVSDRRADLPKDGLPLSLLAELMGQIRCQMAAFHGYDSERQETLFLQHLPGGEDLVVEEDYNALHWQHYWNCQPCSYPDRTGDLRSVVKVTDFYSARQWHSTGMYYDMLPAVRTRARTDADPARNTQPGLWAWPDRAAVLFPRARSGFFRA